MKIKLNNEQINWFEKNPSFDIVLLYNSCIVNDTLYFKKEKDVIDFYEIFTTYELFFELSQKILKQDFLNIIKPLEYNIYE